MLRQITLEQVALNLQTTVEDVQERHNQLMVTRDGQPIMVMLPVDDYERWLAQRDEAFKYLDNLPTRDLPYSEEEVEADIEQAIREVRAEYKPK
jgi:PHD/YefM family antitoxin component YafN of YafNO toxin-antitoxin module